MQCTVYMYLQYVIWIIVDTYVRIITFATQWISITVNNTYLSVIYRQYHVQSIRIRFWSDPDQFAGPEFILHSVTDPNSDFFSFLIVLYIYSKDNIKKVSCKKSWKIEPIFFLAVDTYWNANTVPQKEIILLLIFNQNLLKIV